MPLLIGAIPGVVQGAVSAWQGFGVIWHGCDGSTWDLMDASAGVVMPPDGVRGLGMPTFDRWTTLSPALAGSRYQGSRTQERTFLLPVFIWSDIGTDDFLATETSFADSYRPDVKSTLEIVRPDGDSRFLDLRFVDDNGQTYGQDPAQAGWSVQALNMVADDNPYWYGAPVSRTFDAPNDQQFYLSSGGVVFISPGGTTSTAVITNPGDVDAWPVWVVTGGHGGGTLGAGVGSVVVPAMADGTTWTIDTRPANQIAVDQLGVDQSAHVTWNPAPVPRGTQVVLALAMTSPDSSASITCRLVPQYFRAW